MSCDLQNISYRLRVGVRYLQGEGVEVETLAGAAKTDGYQRDFAKIVSRMIEAISRHPGRARCGHFVLGETVGNATATINFLVVEDLGDGNQIAAEPECEHNRDPSFLRFADGLEERLVVVAKLGRQFRRLVEGSFIEIDVERDDGGASLGRGFHKFCKEFAVRDLIAGFGAEKIVKRFVVDLDGSDPLRLRLEGTVACDPLVGPQLPGDETREVVFEVLVLKTEETDDDNQHDCRRVEPGEPPG